MPAVLQVQRLLGRETDGAACLGGGKECGECVGGGTRGRLDAGRGGEIVAGGEVGLDPPLRIPPVRKSAPHVLCETDGTGRTCQKSLVDTTAAGAFRKVDDGSAAQLLASEQHSLLSVKLLVEKARDW